MPWGVAAAAISVGGSLYASSKNKKAAGKAADREQAAAERAIERQEEAYGNAQQLLNPYVRQESAASNQLMAQMGLGGGGGGGGGGGWGYTDPDNLGAGQTDESRERFLEQLLSEQVAISGRAGYEGKHGEKAVAEGARRARKQLQSMKDQGVIPGDFEIPELGALQDYGWTAVQAAGGHKALRRSDVAGGKRHENYGADDYNAVAERYYPGGEAGNWGREVAAEGEGMMGGGAGGTGTGPGGAMTAGDIMGMAGVEGLPPEIREAYYEDLMAARDPIDLGMGEFASDEYQNYMGLTPESLQVGNEYQQTGAYQAARDQGIEAVNQGAAGTGSLYSGARGEALRDVGQNVEQNYYMDAMNRRAGMMADRRQTYGAELGRRLNEREASLGRMGSEVAGGRAQEQSYYNNYMQMLGQLASPSSTTNLASLEMGIGKDTGAILQDATRSVNNLNIASTNASNQAMGDAIGGVVDLGGAWLSNRK
ncbi:MAG: hypothetical protein ACR2PR_13080 [Pseudohongiellaceae bacterium]